MTYDDHLVILAYYGEDTSSVSKKQAKGKAEQLLAEKLCRCIKKVNDKKHDYPRAIAICRDSVLSKKNLRTHGFKCKKKPVIIGLSRRGTHKKLCKQSGSSRRTMRC